MRDALTFFFLVFIGLIQACGAAPKQPATSPSTAVVAPEPAPAAVDDPGRDKRGVAYHFCGWDSVEGATDLSELQPGLRWYYNWSSMPLRCDDYTGVGSVSAITSGTVEFVPMAWGLANKGEQCAEGGPCFLVDERRGGVSCPEVCAEVDWSMRSDGPCYACYHESVSRSDFMHDIPPNARHLLGYNEPNFKEQANLTPQIAAQGWQHVQWVADQRNLQLVGPATNFCDPTPGAHHAGACIEAVDGHRMFGLAWLERFYDACTEQGAAGFDCRIDYQAVHAYSCKSVTGVIELMKGKAGLKTVTEPHCNNGIADEDEFGVDCGGNTCTACSEHAREMFSKPVWLTEFATDAGECDVEGREALVERTLEFMDRELPLLDNDPYVYRYAWFMPKTDIETLDHCDLLDEEQPGMRTPLGERYLGSRTIP